VSPYRRPHTRFIDARSAASRVAAGLLVAGAALGALMLTGAPADAAFAPDRPMKVPAPAFAQPVDDATQETAVLSGGCFWGLQGVFQHVRGVKTVTAGYAGGSRATANYETVSTGLTRHAESVKIVFDPRQVSFGQLLRVYFSVATDPTQLNRQYPDEGPQYRGEIFYTTPEQKQEADRYIAQLSAEKVYRGPIVTRVDPYVGFYAAEGYHQDYLLKHPDALYIATYDMPKVYALKAMFPNDYRATPAAV
jgi:peptide-methionine (S)-S-oxide reductase